MNFAAHLIRMRLNRPGRSRAQSGATAVEFALVGPLFIFMICIAFDLGLLLFTQSVLNNAARDASRLIQTNQGGGSSAFSTALCNDVTGLIPCASLQYYVQSAASFGAMSAGVLTDAGGNLKNAGTYSAGAPGSDVVVQVAYNRPTIVPWIIPYLNGADAKISKDFNLLVATIAFQNEP